MVSAEIAHEQIFSSGMIHLSCGGAARPMDHATGENLFMIDFRQYELVPLPIYY
jgi:hypothetical protein